MNITVDNELARQRIDKAVASLYPAYPRAALQKLLDSGHITLNGESVKAGMKLRPGDSIEINLSPLDALPENIELPIIYEDRDVIVIDKPSGVISHARGRFFNEASVASFIRQRVAEMSGERAGIVHRLDRATSGVMICARNTAALSWLQKQFSDHKVVKTYVAIVKGSMPTDKGRIDMPLARNPKRPQTFQADPEGKPATTNYEVMKSARGYTMVKLKPETGRTHQLRVHLARLGHPIVGDDLYGGEPAKRLMLHAWSLEILLPSKQKQTFESSIPVIMEGYFGD